MGVNISTWQLARAVSSAGERLGVRTMGVVSGTGIGVVFVRRLQDGDPGGHLRRALDTFPYPEMAERVWDAWYIEGGKAPDKPYKPIPMVNFKLRQDVAETIVCGNYTDVWLAKQGHSGPIGVNYLEKIQTPRLPEILGAMIADVDCVLMGAGIPYQVPKVLDDFAAYRPASYYLDVSGAAPREFALELDPASLLPEKYVGPLRRPAFYAIAATHVLAQYLSDPRRTTGYVDGFVMEGPTAGGHNAPPRDRSKLNARGESVYGPKDEIDLQKMREIDRPFWLAGATAHPKKLVEALEEGAAGCQVGSIFALCNESGLVEDHRRELRRLAFRCELDVFADPRSSPSGFPFNVAQLPGTMSEERVYAERTRVCDIGYLRQAYKTERGTVSFRCPSEPVDTYLRRGGKAEEIVGRKCLCNGLMAAAGVPQIHHAGEEPAIVTLGHNTGFIHDLSRDEDGCYSAEDALLYLLGRRSE
jgi:NAD(P)H-dependent flavin oxidoreductase YrpB (nitropropane dioxygenase family)